MPALLWHRHENKINSAIYFFLYFFILLFIQSSSSTPPAPVPVALWGASISGCLGSRRSLPSNKAHWPLPREHRHSSSSFTSASLLSLSFHPSLPSPSISTWANFDAAFTSTRLSFPGLDPLLSTAASLSLRQKGGEKKKKKAVPPSVNKCLISRLLVPVCLSVCLACRQLSRHSGVAVSQVLVSVLLSVHLPVRASQIRCVNLAPVFFFPFFYPWVLFFFSLPFFSRFSRTGFVKQSASRKHAVFTQSSKLIVAS